MIVTLWSQTKEHAINVLVFGVARVLFSLAMVTKAVATWRTEVN